MQSFKQDATRIPEEDVNIGEAVKGTRNEMKALFNSETPNKIKPITKSEHASEKSTANRTKADSQRLVRKIHTSVCEFPDDTKIDAGAASDESWEKDFDLSDQ